MPEQMPVSVVVLVLILAVVVVVVKVWMPSQMVEQLRVMGVAVQVA